MDRLLDLMGYLVAHPTAALGAVAAVIVLAYLLSRKPKTVREAEQRLGQLRNEKADHYRKSRPLD